MKDRESVWSTISDQLKSWGLMKSPQVKPGRESTDALVVVLNVKGEQKEIGRLTQRGGKFVFTYAESVKNREVPMISDFPSVEGAYESTNLWPFFRTRLPPMGRSDVRRLIAERNIRETDSLRLLGELSGRSITGPYEFQYHPAAREP